MEWEEALESVKGRLPQKLTHSELEKIVALRDLHIYVKAQDCLQDICLLLKAPWSPVQPNLIHLKAY